MLRRRKSDPPFSRGNLTAALAGLAPCEVDVVFTADGHALCLHDRTLDRETTGSGRVGDATRAEIEALRQRAPDGTALPEAPLFLDEVVAAVAATEVCRPALVQLDVKSRADALTPRVVEQLARLLRDSADAFIVSAHDWPTVQRIVTAVPGLHAGFDPLALYPRSFDLDADGFRAVAARALETAPEASIFYAEAALLLAARGQGVDLVRELSRSGADVDAWTIDADHPRLHDVLRTLIASGCQQITSNDPELLAAIVDELVAAPG